MRVHENTNVLHYHASEQMDPLRYPDLESEDVSEQGILHPCHVPHDILDSLHVSLAGLPQGQLVLTMSGNPLHWWGGAPTGAQCLTHCGWGAKSADRSSSQGVRESVLAILIVWVPPALPGRQAGMIGFITLQQSVPSQMTLHCHPQWNLSFCSCCLLLGK